MTAFKKFEWLGCIGSGQAVPVAPKRSPWDPLSLCPSPTLRSKLPAREHILHFVEEASVFGGGVVGGAEGGGELAEEFLLLVAEVGGGTDLEVHLEVAAAVLAQVGDALAAEADDSAALGAGGDLQRQLLAVQGGNRELVAEGGLR